MAKGFGGAAGGGSCTLTITSLSITSVQQGTTPTPITVTGKNFTTTSIVQVNGSSRNTTFSSPTSLIFTPLIADLSNVGTLNITVINTSNTATITITSAPPTPVITSISPSSSFFNDVNSPIDVHGTGFTVSSQVFFGTTQLLVDGTKTSTSTDLYVLVNTALAAVHTTYTCTVVNPGAPTSNGVSFPINYRVPSQSTLIPSSGGTQDVNQAIQIVGNNFYSDSTVTCNGTTISSSFVDQFHLNATIPSSFLGSPGSLSINTVNPSPGGGTSNTLIYTVGAALPIPAFFTPPSAPTLQAGWDIFTPTLGQTVSASAPTIANFSRYFTPGSSFVAACTQATSDTNVIIYSQTTSGNATKKFGTTLGRNPTQTSNGNILEVQTDSGILPNSAYLVFLNNVAQGNGPSYMAGTAELHTLATSRDATGWGVLNCAVAGNTVRIGGRQLTRAITSTTTNTLTNSGNLTFTVASGLTVTPGATAVAVAEGQGKPLAAVAGTVGPGGKIAADIVSNGTTTITSATANFAASDQWRLIYLNGGTASLSGAVYQITSVTNATTVVLNNTVATGTGATLSHAIQAGADYMDGTVTYSGTTLTLAVSAQTGGGRFSSWSIYTTDNAWILLDTGSGIPQVNDVGTTTGTANISSASSNFNSGMVGQSVYISGGSASITGSWYLIATFVDSNHITVSDLSGGAVTFSTGTNATLSSAQYITPTYADPIRLDFTAPSGLLATVRSSTAINLNTTTVGSTVTVTTSANHNYAVGMAVMMLGIGRAYISGTVASGSTGTTLKVTVGAKNGVSNVSSWFIGPGYQISVHSGRGGAYGWSTGFLSTSPTIYYNVEAYHYTDNATQTLNAPASATGTITNVTNAGAGLIKVTCSAPHGLTTGNTVFIQNVIGNVNVTDAFVSSVVAAQVRMNQITCATSLSLAPSLKGKFCKISGGSASLAGTWVRLKIPASGAATTLATDGVTSGSTLTSATNPFTANMVGQSVTLSGPLPTANYLITAFTNAGSVSLGSSPAANTGVTIQALAGVGGYTILTTDGANVGTTLTSASNVFTSTMVGQQIKLQGGSPGITPALFLVDAFVNSGQITLHTAPTGSNTGVTVSTNLTTALIDQDGLANCANATLNLGHACNDKGWTITTVGGDPNSFTLNGSVFDYTYVSGGTWTQDDTQEWSNKIANAYTGGSTNGTINVPASSTYTVSKQLSFIQIAVSGAGAASSIVRASPVFNDGHLISSGDAGKCTGVGLILDDETHTYPMMLDVLGAATWMVNSNLLVNCTVKTLQYNSVQGSQVVAYYYGGDFTGGQSGVGSSNLLGFNTIENTTWRLTNRASCAIATPLGPQHIVNNTFVQYYDSSKSSLWGDRMIENSNLTYYGLATRCTSTNLGPPDANANSGEQDVWDGYEMAPNVYGITAATSNTLQFVTDGTMTKLAPQFFSINQGKCAGFNAIVTKIAGATSNGSTMTLTLDRPFLTLPATDGTSKFNIGHNSLSCTRWLQHQQGTAIFAKAQVSNGPQSGTPVGVSFFAGNCEPLYDHCSFDGLQRGIALYGSQPGGGAIPQQCYLPTFKNIAITGCMEGVWLGDGTPAFNVQFMILGAVFDNVSVTANPSYPTTFNIAGVFLTGGSAGTPYAATATEGVLFTNLYSADTCIGLYILTNTSGTFAVILNSSTIVLGAGPSPLVDTVNNNYATTGKPNADGSPLGGGFGGAGHNHGTGYTIITTGGTIIRDFSQNNV